MGLKDFDSSFPEPKSKKFFELGLRATVGIAKGSVGLAQKIHARVEKINRVRAFNEAQRRAQIIRDQREIRLLELRRHAGFGVNLTGLKLCDLIWSWKEEKVAKDFPESSGSNFSLFVFEAVNRKVEQGFVKRLLSKKGARIS